jgi:hypothetical protein
MNDELDDFLQAHGAKPMDQAILDHYVDAMTETVIPDIVRDVQVREELAIELRYTPLVSKHPA